ncbi:MAG: mechanosensitive ion channel family protein [Waddliaceae bacterium]
MKISKFRHYLIFFILTLFVANEANAQPQNNALPGLDEEIQERPSKKIEVEKVAEDAKIARRLDRILQATGWFQEIEVDVQEGIVFLKGTTKAKSYQEWATELAEKTQDVVAVVNEIEVLRPSVWELAPVREEFRNLAEGVRANGPLIFAVLILIIITWLVAKATVRIGSWLLKNKLKSKLLRQVISRMIAVPVFLLGLYFVLRVSGLTRLALTVLGSTGLIGLVLGFAFRDIAENFLASVLLSMQQPFSRGDLIQVAGMEGVVQSMNIRTTVFMTLDGNHVQIPNATIYKEIITNLTSNANTRFDFIIGIGYEDSIADAQSLALDVLLNHSAVIKDPEPLVLVDSLGTSTVNLRVLFWVDTSVNSRFKVRSVIIRLVKVAFAKAGVSMPDEAREVIFPKGLPVHMIQEEKDEKRTHKAPLKEEPKVSHAAEGNLSTETEEIQSQSQKSRKPEGGADLLEQ